MEMVECDTVWIGGIRITGVNRLIEQSRISSRLHPQLHAAGFLSEDPDIEIKVVRLTCNRRYGLRDNTAVKSERGGMGGTGSAFYRNPHRSAAGNIPATNFTGAIKRAGFEVAVDQCRLNDGCAAGAADHSNIIEQCIDPDGYVRQISET